MGYGLLTVFSNVIEQMMFAYTLEQANPLYIVLMFYSFSIIVIASPLIFKRMRNRANWSSLKTYWKPVTAHLGGSAVGAIGWFASVFLIGISGVAIFAVITRICLISYGILILKEQLSRVQLMCSLIVIYAAYMFSSGASATEKTGILIAGVSSVCFAISAIGQKKIAGKVCTRAILLIRPCFMLIITTALAPFAMPFITVGQATITPELVGQIMVLAVLGGFISKFAALQAMKTMDLSRYTLLMQLKTPLIFIGGVMLLGETWDNQQLVIAIIMFSTMPFLMMKPKKQPVIPAIRA